ncbi:MAG: hypothetical protein ACLFPL_03310 [Candidatus Nanoarchaeia archaeon]
MSQNDVKTLISPNQQLVVEIENGQLIRFGYKKMKKIILLNSFMIEIKKKDGVTLI